MIVAQIRIGGDSETTVSLHPALTVLSGLDPASRQELASELAGALRGQPAKVEVEIEVDGNRESLTPDVVQRLGLQASTAVVVVQPAALPGAAVPPPPAAAPAAPSPADDPGLASFREAAVAAEAAQAAAAAAVAEAEAGLSAAVTGAAAAAEAAAAVMPADGAGADDAAAATADDALAAARGRLEQARQDLAAARGALAEAEAARAQEQEQERDAAAEQERAAQLLERLLGQKAELEQARAELVARLAAIPPRDPEPVQQALVELRRLRAIKPVPSAAAIELAGRWEAIRAKLADLPAPPEPPEWLVAPAMAALQEAREALARAEAGAADTTADPRLVEALDRAHRQVLEGEQKMMRKGSRLHRRRLDQAYEAEQAALSALGVSSYGEYLQRVVPGAGGAPNAEDPAAAARAALADAEAVWEELHGGLASPEWIAAKQEEDQLRAQAHELLGRPVPDAELAAALRSHRDEVVDATWAEEALARAMGAPPAEGTSGPDVEQAAERWLAEAAAADEARAEPERELAQVHERLDAVAREVSEHQADAFFGTTGGPAGAAGEGGDESRRQRLAAATAQVQKAEQEELEAQAALAALEQQAALRHEELQRRAYLRSEAEAARDAVRTAEANVDEARQAQEAAQGAALAAVEAAVAAEAAATAPAASAQPEPDLTRVTALEAEVYLLARLAAVQGGPHGPLPLFVDATTVAGLPEPAGRRVLAILERAAGAVQVVLLGDEGPVGEWATRKGAGAAVVAATRPAQESRR